METETETTATPPELILYGGRRVLTTRMAVQRYARMYGLAERAARSAVARSGVAPVMPPPLHARVPVYDLEALDTAVGRKRVPVVAS